MRPPGFNFFLPPDGPPELPPPRRRFLWLPFLSVSRASIIDKKPWAVLTSSPPPFPLSSQFPPPSAFSFESFSRDSSFFLALKSEKMFHMRRGIASPSQPGGLSVRSTLPSLLESLPCFFVRFAVVLITDVVPLAFPPLRQNRVQRPSS